MPTMYYLLIILMFALTTASSGTKSTTAKPKTTSKTQTTAKPKTTTNPTTTVTSNSCSQTCSKAFADCHNHFKGWFGCSFAYTVCRENLDEGNWANAGCKKKCKDTKKMSALKSCKKSTG